jgi:hypothetical protein
MHISRANDALSANARLRRRKAEAPRATPDRAGMRCTPGRRVNNYAKSARTPPSWEAVGWKYVNAHIEKRIDF